MVKCGRNGDRLPGAGEPPPARAVDWPAVRQAYEDGEEPVRTILDRFKLTRSQFGYRRRKEGWPLRRPRRKRRDPGEIGPLASQCSHDPAAALERLGRVLAAEVARLEMRQDRRSGLEEGEVRHILAVARTLDLMNKGSRTEKSGKGVSAPPSRRHGARVNGRSGAGRESGCDPRGDPAWARAELARRISMLRGPEGA